MERSSESQEKYRTGHNLKYAMHIIPLLSALTKITCVGTALTESNGKLR